MGMFFSSGWGTRIPPTERVDKVFHILFEKRVDDTERIFIGSGIEIKRPAEEMTGGVGKKELICGGGVSAYMEKDTSNAIRRPDDGLIDGAGLDAVFEGHFERVIPQLVKLVRTYLFVTDINARIEPGEIDIDPIGILRHGIEKAAVPDDGRIDRIFEGIGIPRFIKGLVLMRRKIDLEITSSLRRIVAIAGNTE